MNNENQQSQTSKIDSSLGKEIIDELLALKSEVTGQIEEIIARIEQNSDHRLEEAILFLAGSGDRGDSIGFNGSDSRFGHYLAGWLKSGEKLTLKQAEAALQMMQKYSQSQLEPNGYSLPTAWEEISHQYHERTIEDELPPLSVVLKTGDRIVLSTGEYCDTYIAAYYPDETVYEYFVDYSEDIWDYGREGGSVNVLLDAAPRLMGQVASYVEHGYRCYVDPDIEAATYLWEQERQRVVSQREPVLPLYDLPPDTLRLDAVPLESERGADYQRLRELLQQQEWYSADQTTARLIADVCRTAEGSLNAEAIQQLPLADLRTLDRLWVAASGGKFGFSVQKKIWLDLGLTNLEVEDADLDKFGDAVGWGLRGRPIYYRKSPFNLSMAPNGYFPQWGVSSVGSNYSVYSYDWSFGRQIAANFFQTVGETQESFSRSANVSESSSNDTVDPTGDVPLEMVRNVLRPEDYSGVWHGHAVKFSIQQIFPTGQFNGIGEFVGGPHSGIQFGFTGKTDSDGRLTISRDVEIGSQVASDANFEIDGNSIVWQGLTKGPGIELTGLPFEFRTQLLESFSRSTTSSESSSNDTVASTGDTLLEMARNVSHQVENQWGGNDAPWHDGGQWIIGGRSGQNVVELNVKSDDGGNTLNGTMTYEGEGPIGFKGIMIEGR